MTTEKDIKLAKDALISSLFELAKAATDVSTNTVNFFNLTNSTVTNELPFDLAQFANIAQSAVSNSAADIIAVADAATEEGKKTKKRTSSGASTSIPALSSQAFKSTTDEAPQAAVATPKKKVKVPKDPNAPKKPLTSYLLFCNSVRKNISFENPSFSQVDIAQESARLWKELTDEQKLEWKNKYEKDKEIYTQEMVKYNAKKDDIVEPAAAIEIESPEDEEIAVVDEPKKKKQKKSKKKESKKD